MNANLTATDEDMKEEVRRDSFAALTDGGRSHPSERTGARLQWDPGEGIQPIYTPRNELVGVEITAEAYMAIAIASTVRLYPAIMELASEESEGDGPPTRGEIGAMLENLTDRFAPEEGDAVAVPDGFLSGSGTDR